MPTTEDANDNYVTPSVLAPILDGAGLIAEVSKRKAKANEYFTMGLFDAALQSYLTAIWYLKVVRPSYPAKLAEQLPPRDTEATLLLGAGTAPAAAPPPAPVKQTDNKFASYVLRSAVVVYVVVLVAVSAQVALAFGAAIEVVVSVIAILVLIGLWSWHLYSRGSSGEIAQERTRAVLEAAAQERRVALEGAEAHALRLTLHLNVAACALKRNDWYLAREAANFVLASEPHHPKALLRLAQVRLAPGEDGRR